MADRLDLFFVVWAWSLGSGTFAVLLAAFPGGPFQIPRVYPLIYALIAASTFSLMTFQIGRWISSPPRQTCLEEF